MVVLLAASVVVSLAGLFKLRGFNGQLLRVRGSERPIVPIMVFRAVVLDYVFVAQLGIAVILALSGSAAIACCGYLSAQLSVELYAVASLPSHILETLPAVMRPGFRLRTRIRRILFGWLLVVAGGLLGRLF